MTAVTQHGSEPASANARFGLWLWNCDVHGPSLLALDVRADVLTPDERLRAGRLTNDVARERWVCARVALRRALGAWTGAQIERRAFEITAAGRPYLPGSAPHFSLSHAGPFVLTAICEAGVIGADIEQISVRKIAAPRRERLEVFAQQLGGALPAEADARFIQAWCRIEALAKAEGCGVGRLLTRAGLMGPGGSGGEGRGRREDRNAEGLASTVPGELLRAIDACTGPLAPGYAAAMAAPASVLSGAGARVPILDGAALLTI